MKEGRPNVVDLIKGERIQLHHQHAPRRASPGSTRKPSAAPPSWRAFPTITTLSAARAAAEGIAALQRGEAKVYALQTLHAERVAAAK